MFSKYGNSNYAHPNPVHYRDNYKWRPEFYHLAGRILGKYLVELSLDRLKTPVFKASLSRSLLSRLIGFLPTHEDVKVDDPQVYEKRFLPVLEAVDVSTLSRTFSEEFDCLGNYLQRPIELIPGGSGVAVTNENRERYLNCLAKYYMSTISHEEIYNIRTGFYALVPEEILTILNAEDLERILKYGKTSEESKKKFWSFFSFPCCSSKPNHPGPSHNRGKPCAPWESCRQERYNYSNPEKDSNSDKNPSNRFKLPKDNDNFPSPIDDDELTREMDAIHISRKKSSEGKPRLRESRFAPQPQPSGNNNGRKSYTNTYY